MSVAMANKHQADSVADISFDLERLFDPYNFDHIPLDKRLDQFKQRDLAHIKHYKAAVKIFGGPPMRTRVIVAPPMETPLKHRLGYYMNKVSTPPPPTLNGTLRSPPEPKKNIPDEVKQKIAEDKKRDDYKQRIASRKKIEDNLKNLIFDEEFLGRKLNKSELEKRVQARFRAARLWKPDPPTPAEVIPPPKPLPGIPIVAVPPPEGLQILDKFLSLNRLRLMDLFLLADKDKSWSISREKFISLVSKAEIPLSESEVDDLMITLDTNADNKLDYQELNQGLTQWRKQRRDLKKQEQKSNSFYTSDEKLSSKDKDIYHVQEEYKAYAKERSFADFFSDNVLKTSKHDTAKTVPVFVSSKFEDTTLNLTNETDFQYDYNDANVEPIDDNDEINSETYFLQMELSVPDDTNTVPAPKVQILTEDTKDSFEKTRVKSSKSSYSGSHLTNSRSHTSNSNTLEVPEPDLREEMRVPESMESMLDNRKLNRVILSRSSMRKNLSPVERLVFDEKPGCIKIGYKPIDDHCSESTLGGEAADKVNQFRQEKLKEYYEVKKMFEDRGLPFTLDTLNKVLLYPGDRPTKHIQAELKASSQPKTLGSNRMSLGKQLVQNHKLVTTQSGHTITSRSDKDVSRTVPSRMKGISEGTSSTQIGKVNKRRHLKYHTVTDVYPLASKVKHSEQEEELSSGTAFIKSKLDNWMTFEEYNKYTKNLKSRYSRGKHKSNPDADWTGYLLDKLYLCMDHDHSRLDGKGNPIKTRDSSAYSGLGVGMYNGRGNAVFQETRHMKRAYPGYNNDLLTWPVGENGVRYGNIDEHRLIR
ncbi:EF-hand calcium-binding domain-containing protein 12 [Biomphalaria glabrata]|nr:hypothetical protein BgiMline_033714 [Biomphalaria glabrata]